MYEIFIVGLAVWFFGGVFAALAVGGLALASTRKRSGEAGRKPVENAARNRRSHALKRAR